MYGSSQRQTHQQQPTMTPYVGLQQPTANAPYNHLQQPANNMQGIFSMQGLQNTPQGLVPTMGYYRLVPVTVWPTTPTQPTNTAAMMSSEAVQNLPQDADVRRALKNLRQYSQEADNSQPAIVEVPSGAAVSPSVQVIPPRGEYRPRGSAYRPRPRRNQPTDDEVKELGPYRPRGSQYVPRGTTRKTSHAPSSSQQSESQPRYPTLPRTPEARVDADVPVVLSKKRQRTEEEGEDVDVSLNRKKQRASPSVPQDGPLELPTPLTSRTDSSEKQPVDPAIIDFIDLTTPSSSSSPPSSPPRHLGLPRGPESPGRMDLGGIPELSGPSELPPPEFPRCLEPAEALEIPETPLEQPGPTVAGGPPEQHDPHGEPESTLVGLDVGTLLSQPAPMETTPEPLPCPDGYYPAESLVNWEYPDPDPILAKSDLEVLNLDVETYGNHPSSPAPVWDDVLDDISNWELGLALIEAMSTT